MADYRARQRARGLVRVEVRTAREDAELVRGVAKALSDPERAASARAALSKLLTPAPDLDFKAFLTAVSFEGVDLERRRDFGRHVEL